MARNAIAYEEDFFAWTQEQVRLLREGEFSEIDAANIAEELDSMGKSDRRELRTRLGVLLMHLLKWAYQADQRSRSWLVTIREQRDQIAQVLADSPSLRPVVRDSLGGIYRRARANAADETNLPETAFPAKCPFTAEQILSEEFLPEG
jgi:Domain of unknown function DUF29